MLTNDHADHHNRARYAGLTPAERQTIKQHRVEAALFQKKLADHNLATAVRLGAALRALKDEA